jgi:adenylosuccinate synthase
MKTKKAYVVIGLGYGDEGKGTMVDYLCRKNNATLVVRFNGGAQAGHNVVTSNGRHHTFSLFGSGTFVSGVRTLLSRFVLFDPISLSEEVAELSPKIGENALDRICVDFRAPIVTPFHVATNRMKEWLRGGGRHGSCGKGIGETGSDVVKYPHEVIHARDLAFPEITKKLLTAIQLRKHEELLKLGVDFENLPDFLQDLRFLFTDIKVVEEIARVYSNMAEYITIVHSSEANRMIRESDVVFEGAQGVLLDEWHGFHPYATYSSTTSANVFELLKEAKFEGETEVIGVTRSYGTRHGAGPFITEDESFSKVNPNEHNYLGRWQGNFRTGYFDFVSLEYAIRCLRHYGNVDAIALTHADAFARKEILPFCNQYYNERGETEYLTPGFLHDLEYQRELTKTILKAYPTIGGEWHSSKDAIFTIEKSTGIPVKYISSGPTSGDKQTRE